MDMKKNKFLLLFGLTILLSFGLIAFTSRQNLTDDKILSYTVNAKSQELKFYWRDDSAKIFNSLYFKRCSIKYDPINPVAPVTNTLRIIAPT